jgi:hypothetical protein
VLADSGDNVHKLKLITPLAVGAAAVGLAVTAATPASATPTASVTTLTTKVFGPFNIDVKGHRVLVADGFNGVVSRIRPNGNLRTVASNPGGDTSGVASGDGMIAYTSGDGMNGHQRLHVIRPGRDLVVNISRFERNHNADRVNFYGVRHPSACVRQTLEAADFPVAYHGVVDAHAYSVAYAGHGWWLVGDAAGNDILKVSPTGHISVVRVLPHQPVTFTAETAAQAGLPPCFAGVTYNFEPVPTDVEVHHGHIYMSLLPGGPEDPSFGARGSAYRMRMDGSGLTKIGSGFLGTTNIAVSPKGAVYVSELFRGQVSKIVNGHGVKVASLPGPLGLEFANGDLYAGVIASTDDQGNPTGPGSVVRIDLG